MNNPRHPEHKRANKAIKIAMGLAALGAGAGLGYLLTDAYFNEASQRGVITNPDKHMGIDVVLRGNLKFKELHRSGAPGESKTVSYRGKVADLSNTGILEFVLTTDDGEEIRVFVPSTFTTLCSPSGLDMFDSYQPGSGLIRWDSATNGAYNRPAIVNGRITETAYGAGVLANHVYIKNRCERPASVVDF
jgi:hypothetical protein